MNMFELSQKTNKNGYKKFKLAIAEIYPDSCVKDNVGTQYNDNGITWLKEYCERNLSSLEDSSLAVDFLDEDRTEATGHGETGVIKDGIPLLNATTIGHFKRGYIIEDGSKTLLMGEGYIDYMRYHDFIDELVEKLKDNETVYGSVEIVRKSNNKSINYLYGYKDFGRIPTDFEFSGYAILGNGVVPADKQATLLEVASKNKEREENIMDEKMLGIITDSVKSTITECNSKNAEYENRISELNNTIEEKDKKISELNNTIAEVQKALDDIKKEQDASWAEREALEKELGELKAQARINSLNKALETFSDEEKECVKDEIESFKKDTEYCEINSIVDKIYSNIGKNAKEQSSKIAEQNSNNTDIFGDVDEVETELNESNDFSAIFN